LSHCSKSGASASKKSAFDIPQERKPKVLAADFILAVYSDFKLMSKPLK
jgi:hypothetical protein